MPCAALSSMRNCHFLFDSFWHQSPVRHFLLHCSCGVARAKAGIGYPHSNLTASTLCSHAHAPPHFPSSCHSNSTQLSKSQGSVSSSSGWGCPSFFGWLHLYHGYHQATFCCPLRQVVSYIPACCQGNCWSCRTANTSSLKNGEHCY